MNNRMFKFLTSLGLPEPERFDMDFTLVGMSPSIEGQLDMFIQKETPWDYELLSEFLEGLSHVHYPYSIRFSYPDPIAFENVFNLFQAWRFMNYAGLPVPFELKEKSPGVLVAVYTRMEDMAAGQRVILAFQDLLKFINYTFSFVSEIEPEKTESPAIPKPEPVIEETKQEDETVVINLDDVELPEEEPLPVEEAEPAEEEPIEEEEDDDEVEEEAVEAPSSEPITEENPTLSPLDYRAMQPEELEQIRQAAEEERKENQEKAEAALLKLQEENLRRMIEEREQAKKFKIGNYHAINHINEIYQISGENVDFSGEIFESDVRTTQKGSTMGVFGIGDGDGAITIRCFGGKRIPENEIKAVKVGDVYRVRGAVDTDKFSGQKMIVVHFLDRLPPKAMRDDPEPEKRVELHLHTNMSTMDALPDFKEYYNLAKHMGMSAIAITDHGVVQNFPAAQAARENHIKQIKAKNLDEKPLKIIYGSELYMFNLEQTYILNPSDLPLKGGRYCVFDTETTGLSARYDRIIEIGAVLVEDGRVISRFQELINPEMHIPEASTRVNHITDQMVADKPKIAEILPRFLEFIGDTILVAHNATFDVGFIDAALERLGKEPLSNPVIDTIPLSHYLFPLAGRHSEGAMLRNLGLNVYDESDAHRASYDAEALSEGWLEIVHRLEMLQPGIRHKDLQDLQIEWPDVEDVSREDADEGNRSRFLRAANKFMPFWHSVFPKDPVPLHFKHFDEAYAAFRTFNEKENPESLHEHYEEVCNRFFAYSRHLREYHVTALVRNQSGLRDLYKLITQGHTTYLARVPKTPRSMLQALRKNLLLGSACFNGEIFELALTRKKDALVEAMKFYDFIEIQPIENYSYLIHTERLPSQEHLIEVLKDIVEAAHLAGKPVVATGDCHYLNPEDKILRDVYIEAKAIGGGAHPMMPPRRRPDPKHGYLGMNFENPDQHFHSTKEMLDSFMTWMSEEEAREYVITNSNLIASQIEEDVIPVSDNLFPPDRNLPDSDKKIRELCYGKFSKVYEGYQGSDPEVREAIMKCKARLDRELEGIISHGYAVTYYIAHLLIKMANDEPEHYLVGSRGSVGSSFAATMADITEVNPLPPHYHCPNCGYLHFEDVTKYKSGFDLPNKKCPECGGDLDSNGQNIPFETFLGFSADKVPDIDLNFEEESQHKAHNYTKLLLGEHNVFRAGTIETVAEKTAYGYVRGYFEQQYLREGLSEAAAEEKVSKMNPTFLSYLAARCQGVKRTTGQHPGGIVVVPKEKSVFDFTAVQHPANDLSSEWLTTHYDFNSMHDEILKFDILGHDAPKVLRLLRDLTHIRVEDIPMNDPDVLKVFDSVEPLKLSENYLNQRTGALALPEFGTETTQRLLTEAHPKTFNDLLIISGVSHGTDVWAGNIEDLVVNQGKKLNDIIGCRDDIMNYLITKGVDASTAFKFMEVVRKNKEHCNLSKINAMIPEIAAHGVPDWYLESCRKIQYLFPRAHATAYVMNAVRSAYFKLYHPLEFYAVFFSVNCDDWDIDVFIRGKEAVFKKYSEYQARKNDRINPLSKPEQERLKSITVAVEMLERGYRFLNIDLYRSQATMFVPDHERKGLIPPFCTLHGLGASAGQSVVDARERLGGKEFLSKDQILRETKLSKTNLADLEELGVLDGMSETNQLTLF